MARTPRTSLKKHDAQQESRTLKARRQRSTMQVRKDKRQAAVQAKRKRLLSTDDTPMTGRNIAELTRILSTATNASGATSASHQERFQVLKEIRVLLASQTNDYEAMDSIVDSGIVPVLVELLNSASPLASATRTGGEVYKEVLWCLTNIATGQYEQTKLVMPAVPRLLQFLDGSNHVLAEHAAWVLGNIAADCEEFRRELIAQGAIAPLVKQLGQSTEKELVRNCAWALSNLARGPDGSGKPFVDAGVVPVLSRGLVQGHEHSFSEATVVEAAWLLSFLTAREEDYLKMMLENGLVDWLLPYFATSSELLLTPILRVFGNICCGAIDHHTDDWQMPYIHRLLSSDSVFLPKLQEFLQPEVETSHAHLVSESAWVVSNLATLDPQVVEILLQRQFLPLLLHHFKATAFDVRREVAFALTNIALTSPQHLETVLQGEVLPGFLQLLQVADVAVVGNSLRFVENVLRSASRGVALVESCGGIDALENVQFQSSEPHLAKWAEALVNEFYGENYGVHSPTNTGDIVHSFSENTLSPANVEMADGSGLGRGRGAHMTTPAWKK